MNIFKNSIYKKITSLVLVLVIITLPVQINGNLIMNQGAVAAPTQSTYLANLAGHWSGDNTLNDSSGNARHMAWGDETGSYRTGQFNNAFNIFFTTSSDNSFTTTPNVNDFEGNGGDMSGAFFIKFDTLPGAYGTVLEIGNSSAAGSSWNVSVNTSNQLQFQASNGTFFWNAICTSVTFAVDTWYHVYFAFDDSSDTVDIRVDGGTVHQDTGFTVTLRDLTAPLTIGRPSTSTVDAAVDEVIIVTRELTSTEQTHHRENGVVY